MNKKMISSLLLISIIGSTIIINNINMVEAKANQSITKLKDTNSVRENTITTVDEFINTELGEKFNVEKLDKAPKNAEVANFHTWDEAYEYLERIEIESVEMQKESKEYMEKMGKAIPSGVDGYSVRPIHRPSGTTTKSYTVAINVPGLSAQRIVSDHTISFRNKQIVSANRGSYIEGFGLAKWNPYYSGLDNYSTSQDSVIKGKCDYYISVGGIQVGASQKWGLVLVINK